MVLMGFTACSTPPTLPPRYTQQAKQPDPRVPKGHTIIATIGEAEVREWFARVSFPDFTFNSLSNEFHPDDGNLLATYKSGPKRMVYLSYVDNVRMSRYAFPRSAREIVSVGNARGIKKIQSKGRTWYCAASPMPIMATDIDPNVKVVLVGYSGVPLKQLIGLAPDLPMDMLAHFAATGPRSKLKK